MCIYAEKPVVIESNEPKKYGTDALTDGINIYVNPCLNDKAKDFAVSHEYYHLQKMQKMLKSENYLPRGVKVKNDPNEEEKANEFAIENYNNVKKLALEHISDREGTIKPKGEVWPLRINLENLCGLFGLEHDDLDIVKISTGGEPLSIPVNTIVDNATLQEKIAIRKDMDLKNPETKLIFVKVAVGVWNKSNVLGEDEDIVFEGHGCRKDLRKPYSKENPMVNMQEYMDPKNIAEIVDTINKPENWHGRILLMGCRTADLVDSVSDRLSNRFLVMGTKDVLTVVGENEYDGICAGFIRDAFRTLTEGERFTLQNFYIFCKYSIKNLIDFMNNVYEHEQNGSKKPERGATIPIEQLKKLRGVGEELKEMGDATVLNCIRDEETYNKLLARLGDHKWVIGMAMKGSSKRLEELIYELIDTEKYIKYFESEIFHMLNFDESDPYIYTRKPEPVAVAASGAEAIENFVKKFYIAIKTLADTQMPGRKDITKAEIEKALNLLGEKLTPDQQTLMKEYFAKGKTGFKSDSTKVCDAWLRNIGKLKSKKTDEEMRSSLATPASQAQRFNLEEFLKFILEKFPQLREDAELMSMQ